MLVVKVSLKEKATCHLFTVREDDAVACLRCMTHLPVAYMLEKEFREQHLEDACWVS